MRHHEVGNGDEEVDVLDGMGSVASHFGKLHDRLLDGLACLVVLLHKARQLLDCPGHSLVLRGAVDGEPLDAAVVARLVAIEDKGGHRPHQREIRLVHEVAVAAHGIADHRLEEVPVQLLGILGRPDE